MKIRALKNYTDKELDKAVAINEVYEVSEERGNYIISRGYAIAAEVEEPKQKEKTIEIAKVEEPKEEKAVIKKTLTARKRITSAKK